MNFRIPDSADLIKPLVEEEFFLVLQLLMENQWFALAEKSSDFCIDACYSMQYFCSRNGGE